MTGQMKNWNSEKSSKYKTFDCVYSNYLSLYNKVDQGAITSAIHHSQAKYYYHHYNSCTEIRATQVSHQAD